MLCVGDEVRDGAPVGGGGRGRAGGAKPLCQRPHRVLLGILHLQRDYAAEHQTATRQHLPPR